jgi:hypothetical protein
VKDKKDLFERKKRREKKRKGEGEDAGVTENRYHI